MKQIQLLALIILFSLSNSMAQSADESFIRRIYDVSLTEGQSYENLRSLCKDVGGRLSGSPEAAKAVTWAYKRLQGLDLDTVYLQDVMVPHWVRGDKEELTAQVNDGDKVDLAVCALGGSVGTKRKGIKAEIIEVFSLDELESIGKDKIKGKIIFYNRPMEPRHINTFDAYSGCVDQRTSGAAEAAPYGAKAVLVRSMNLRYDDLPHTGVQRYVEGVDKIPAAAISVQAADYLHDALKVDPNLEVHLKMSCKNLPDALSYNVIGEMKGSKYPDEIILVGAHLDSWDLNEGAHDDGAGCAHMMEVFHIFNKLNHKPERTIRCVLYMNEENGAKGAAKYAEFARNSNNKHLAAIESDQGGFTPRGFAVDGVDGVKEPALKTLQSYSELLKPYDLHFFEYGFSGVDIVRLKDQKIALFGFVPDSQRYFDYHHAPNDNFEAVNKRELELGAASITSLVYLLSKYGIKH